MRLTATARPFAAALTASVFIGSMSAQTPPAAAIDATQPATYTFAKTTSVQARKEIEQMLRTIAVLKDLDEAPGGGSFTVHGTASQLDLTGWLFPLLDGAAERPRSATAVEERAVAGSPNDIVRVYFLARPTGIQDFQEACQAIRTVATLRSVFTYNAAMALAVRATSDQQTMTAWLVQELERKAPLTPPSKTVTDVFPGATAADSLRVAFLANSGTVQEFQEAAQAARSAAEVRQVFTHNTLRALALRGPASNLDIAQWILEELDRPAAPSVAFAAHERRVDPAKDDFVRVFFVAGAPKANELQALAKSVRDGGATRTFTINERGAILVRDTAFNLNAAESKVRNSGQR